PAERLASRHRWTLGPRPHYALAPRPTLDLRSLPSPPLPLRKGALTPADLAPLPIITNPNPSHLYTSITSWFAAAGVQPAHLNTCNSLVIMTRLALEGAAISLLPSAILRKEIDSGALRLLNVSPRIAPHALA